MSKLQTMLTRVREGHMTFREFILATKIDFQRMALHLVRRWMPPEWHTIQDVEQDLYIGTWKYLDRFNPSYGVSLARYIVYNAFAFAKTAIHKARGVTICGSPDRKASNIETPLTFIGETDGAGEALMESILAQPAEAEEALIADEDRRKVVQKMLRLCETNSERQAVLAIREAKSLDGAGSVLYDDIDCRIDLRLHSKEHADRFVFRQARALASRVAEVY